MFSTLANITSYLWKNSDSHDDFSSFNDEENNINNFNEFCLYEDERPNDEYMETNSFFGTITSINHKERYGLINKNIYFDFKVVYGETTFNIGDNVTGNSVRYNEHDSWVATTVFQTTECWETETDVKNSKPEAEPIETTLEEKKAVIATVSHMDEDKLIFNDTLQIATNVLNIEYPARKGDWVKIELMDNGKYTIRALRKLKISNGKITWLLRRGCGVVDNKILFTEESSLDNLNLKRGDIVELEAVESKQKNYEWRAIRIAKAKLKREGLCPLLNNNFGKLLHDSNGIKIPFDLDFFTVNVGNTKYLTVWLSNSGNSTQKLLKCKLHENSHGINQFYIGKVQLNGKISNYPISILPGKVYHLNVICTARQLGLSEQLLLFEFEGFTLGRILKVNVQDPKQDAIIPNGFYRPKTMGINRLLNYKENPNSSVIPGEKPWRTRTRFSKLLPTFPIPEELWNIILQQKKVTSSLFFLREELSLANYKQKFHTLLYLEEIQMNINIKEFSLDQVCFQPCREYLALEVPGLAENRPSLLIGDRVTASDPVEKSCPVYEGYIHEIHKDRIMLKFNELFHNKYNGESYDVEFHFNRVPMRRCHQAVEEALKIPENVIFPTKIVCKHPQVHLIETNALVPVINSPVKELDKKELIDDNKQKNATFISSGNNSGFCCPIIKNEVKLPSNNASATMKWYNTSLNDRQKIAVRRILNGNCRPIPYVIFGPPGTGKTVTVVECILQVFSNISSSRILACTPSNSAADLIVERLAESKLFTEADMVRLNAFHRTNEMIPDTVKPFCKKIEDIASVSRCRVIVCTCITAGNFYTLNLTTDHFTHLFLDEAGEATEPESLISIELVATAEGQIVLAGDPKQLGPVISSLPSKENGLQTSFLERIMALPLYQRNPEKYKGQGNYNPLLVTKLINNYRSHSSIISLSSRLFYDSELQFHAPESLQNKFCDWEELPKKNFPIIFCGVRGEDFREGNSPSWFNPFEVLQVIKYLKILYDLGISSSDIGVITPYRKQVEKIRFMINMNEMEMCKIGSVEEFQGQERLVIIISTVRATEDQISFDVKHNLGFLVNPKRFNVAITRAQSLLIIVGDPYLLYHDEHWKELVSYCLENGAYCGSPISSSKIQDMSVEE